MKNDINRHMMRDESGKQRRRRKKKPCILLSCYGNHPAAKKVAQPRIELGTIGV